MDLVEFADGPAQVGIFSLQECHDMFLHFTASLKPKLAYPIVPRAGLKPQVKLLAIRLGANPYMYDNSTTKIKYHHAGVSSVPVIRISKQSVEISWAMWQYSISGRSKNLHCWLWIVRLLHWRDDIWSPHWAEASRSHPSRKQYGIFLWWFFQHFSCLFSTASPGTFLSFCSNKWDQFKTGSI